MAWRPKVAPVVRSCMVGALRWRSCEIMVAPRGGTVVRSRLVAPQGGVVVRSCLAVPRGGAVVRCMVAPGGGAGVRIMVAL